MEWSLIFFKYTILLVLIFIIESIIGLLSYVYQDKLGTDLQVNIYIWFVFWHLVSTKNILQDNLKEHFIYPYSFNQDSTIAVDNIQQKVNLISDNKYQGNYIVYSIVSLINTRAHQELID